MFIPTVYAVALSMIVFSMLAWGSWANVLKLCEGWRFELLYWDYVWGTLLMALILGFTLGHTGPAGPDSFMQNL
ncbi:MAG: AcrB/AcrD/AcrF family protein, partial [Terriglobia bacterium]